MADINTVTITGRLTRDPETRTVGGKETTLSEFAVANNFWNGKEEEANYFDVKAWGKLGDLCGKYLAKGRQVTIEAELRQEKWQNKEGENRSKIVLSARNVMFGSGEKTEAKTETKQKQTKASSEDSSDLPF